MSVQPPDFPPSACLRASLKHGLACEAIRHAGRHDADMPAIFDAARHLRPNRKSVERLAGRLAQVPGVVRLARSPGDSGLVVVLRNQRHLVHRIDALDLFEETAVVYTRVRIVSGRLGVGFDLMRASFCLHALERLVERSDVALNRPLLASVDAEATGLLWQMARGRVIADAGDRLIQAVTPGVWAGGIDETRLEDDWSLTLSDPAARIAVFSARTFLGPGQMRRAIWAKWHADPAVPVAA